MSDMSRANKTKCYKCKNNSLAGYYCEKCKTTYISDVLYKMYTANKTEKNIDVIFVKA